MTNSRRVRTKTPNSTPSGPRNFRITATALSASGLAGVWAREALFDAMERKEVYASTGTRLTVRVFAGWEFKPEEVDRPNFAPQGYRRDVPMGGDLANAPAGKSPTLMIRALRDDIAKASQAINGVKLYPPAKAGQRISYHESQARKAAARYSSG